MSKARKEGFSMIGLGAAACVACCAGPIIAFLGGISIAGISTWAIGSTGLVIAAASAAAFVVVRRRRQPDCDPVPSGPVPVELTTRHATR